MRQAGYLAAAGIYALDHHVQRLSQDHKHAAALAEALQQTKYVASVMPVETNIVIFEVAAPYKADVIVHLFAERGLACSTTSSKTIRMVTHLGLSSAMIDMAIETIKDLE